MLDTTERLKLRARFASNAPRPFTLADLDALLDDHRELAIRVRRLEHRSRQLEQLMAQISAYYGGLGELRDLQRGYADHRARLIRLEAVERAARGLLAGGPPDPLADALRP